MIFIQSISILIGINMRELNLYTYGNSAAAITLAKILNVNTACIKYVSRTWTDYTLGMNKLDEIDSPIKSYLMSEWTQHFICIIDKNERMNEEVKSYLSNIVKARLAKSQKQNMVEKQKQKRSENG